MIATSTFASEVADLIDREPIPETELSGHPCLPAGALKPRNRIDVLRLVQAAARHRVRLHAFSCGKNWGFGSARTRKPGTWMVNLAAMNRMTGYDREVGTIVIEPGVTQIELYKELDRLGDNWFFNVTGAGNSTSVLGNALERGIGYYGQRHLDLIELDVVTGRGEIIKTRPAATGPAAFGLDLTQLFVQSAFGIVVGARLRLLPRTTGGGAAIARLKDKNCFPEFIQTTLRLKQEGAIAGVPHIANRERIYTTLAPWTWALDRQALADKTAPWTAVIPVTGCREMTEACFTLIRDRLHSLCEIETIFASRGSASDEGSPMEQLHLLASGYPSNLALAGVEWSALGKSNPRQRDPERTGAGLIHVTPSMSSSVDAIRRAILAIEEGTDRLGLSPLPMTVNVVDQCTTVVIVSIGFPAREASKFRSKARNLEAHLRQAGLLPYRIGLGQEGWPPHASAEAVALHHKLRSTFDPFRVFAVSKYEAAYAVPRRVSRQLASSGRPHLVPEVV